MIVGITQLLKPILGLKNILLTPKGLAVSLPTVTIVGKMADKQIEAWVFLAIVYTIDFITGNIASFIKTLKEAYKKNPKMEEIIKSSSKKIRVIFYIEHFVNNFSSKKLRLSLIKGVGYIAFIFALKYVQEVFMIKTFKLESISHLEWDLTMIALASCIAIEIWSILFENLKEMGFDLIARITGLSKTYKEVKETIKD